MPASCCIKDQYGKYVNIQKCQTWTLGPPGRQQGQTNEAICYRVNTSQRWSFATFLFWFASYCLISQPMKCSQIIMQITWLKFWYWASVLEINKNYVPESCCVTDQNMNIRDKRRCQQFNEGPPGIKSGLNKYVYYKVLISPALK